MVDRMAEQSIEHRVLCEEHGVYCPGGDGIALGVILLFQYRALMK